MLEEQIFVLSLSVSCWNGIKKRFFSTKNQQKAVTKEFITSCPISTTMRLLLCFVLGDGNSCSLPLPQTLFYTPSCENPFPSKSLLAFLSWTFDKCCPLFQAFIVNTIIFFQAIRTEIYLMLFRPAKEKPISVQNGQTLYSLSDTNS